ncbi:IclR family transcriptional regulator [Arthrobacter sp. ISL-85]|uniref:IclR family transcriptional regulator n=1 Tax=Arthrobacter sp. ISL-85 TaxID=2819115 RepID=UPI001BEAB6D2|nr:IclR family transcriptional regulator [Arthrobacter sp. ISL-85]MBT2565070.1 IclR family transcriptional regulator [Arthrobacter sp. ISL-85]
MAVEPKGVVKSADRVLDVFELLGRWGSEMSHAELAEVLNIPKSSLTPLLRNLVARNFVEYDPISKGYRLGDAFVQLAQRTGRERSLLGFIHPIVVDLSSATGESVTVTQLKGDQGETIDSVSGPHRLVSHMRAGDRGPLYALSGGKAILAHLPQAMLSDYLRRVEFERITPNTIASTDELVRQLEEVRRTGYSFVDEEFTFGIVGIGAPILADDGFPIGAISVVMPSVRLTDESQAQATRGLTTAIERISRQLTRLAAAH